MPVSANDVHIVQIALKNLYEHSKYQSWEHFDLLMENSKLKKKIEVLESEVYELKKNTEPS